MSAMNKTLLLLSLTLLGASGTVANAANPSQTSIRYHEAREAMTVPPYSLPKVQGMIRKLKKDSEYNSRLAPKAFNALSFEEKFTYTMLHGEDFSQNCAVMPGIVQEERKIFAFTPAPFNDEGVWSKQQSDFLKENRVQVIGLMRRTMLEKGHVGSNFKHAIVETQAVELIPDLVNLYKRNRTDHDLLTVLMVLMKERKYRPFRATPVYRKLFGDETRWDASVPATPANQRLILDLAMRFYQSTRK